MSSPEPPSPPPAPDANKDKKQTLSTKAAGIVGIAVMCSRVLGLVRELVFAALFGASRSLDAFLMAFRTPNLLRDLFAEGALSTAFVTTFSQKIAKEGDKSAWRLANKVATLTAVFMSLIAIGGVLLAPWIVRLLAPGWDAEKIALTVLLARIMYPFILLVSLAALVMGMLNARHVFGMPAMASSFFNIGSIAGGVALGWWLDPAFGPRALVGLSIGTLIGGFLQLAVQLPSLWRVGYRFRPDFAWRDPGVKMVLSRMGPAVIAASAVQVNVLVNSIFASYLQDGAVSWLNIAFRLMQLPLGVFGVAIGTVTLPVISRSAAVGDTDGFREVLGRGMRLAMLLTVPSALGLAALDAPIISLIYERGKFTYEQTLATASALRFYALGLVAYSTMKVLTPAFYALDRNRTPMLISFLSVGTNVLLNWLFTFQLGWGHQGLAFSTGLVATINFLILYGIMARHLHGLDTGRFLGTLGRLLVAGALLVAVCLAARAWLFTDLAGMPTLAKLLAVLGTIAVAGAVFGAAVYVLKIDEVHDLSRVIARKLVRRAASGA